MNKFILAISFFVSFAANAQTKEHVIQAMDNLVGGTWKLEAFWMNGTPFNREHTVTKILNDNIYHVETVGNISEKGYEKGLRIIGLRGWNKEKYSMEYSDADVFGNMVQGEIKIDGLDILYQYEFGGIIMTDAWIYKGPDLYEYISGVLDEE